MNAKTCAGWTGRRDESTGLCHLFQRAVCDSLMSLESIRASSWSRSKTNFCKPPRRVRELSQKVPVAIVAYR